MRLALAFPESLLKMIAAGDKQNCNLRLARCVGRLLMQITSKDHLDNLIRSLCRAALASIKNC
jgi:hypothetical protein